MRRHRQPDPRTILAAHLLGLAMGVAAIIGLVPNALALTRAFI